MRDYHPGRLPFFAWRNSHFDQFEFFAGPVTLARPHLRLATFCATILISSSPLSPIPLVSFLTLSLSLFFLSFKPRFLSYDTSRVRILHRTLRPILSLDRNDSFHLAMTFS